MVKWICNIVCIVMVSTAYSQDLKLMTYNLRLDVESDGENKFDNRKANLINQIKFYEPDIMGTQEGLPHQITYLSENLNNYSHFGQGRDGGSHGESVAIFYKSDRFSIDSEKTIWLSETPDVVSMGWDAKYNRVCTYALFSDLNSGTKFWVFNTHLDHAGETARKESITLVLNTINDVNKDNYPVVFMGDFNLEPDHPSLNQLKENFNDSRIVIDSSAFGSEGTFNGFKVEYPFKRRIDYIYTSKSKNLKVNKYAVLDDIMDGRFPSDHFPVYIELTLNN